MGRLAVLPTRVGPPSLGELAAPAAPTSARLGTTPDWLYRQAKRLPFTVRLGPRQLRFSSRGITRYIRQRQAYSERLAIVADGAEDRALSEALAAAVASGKLSRTARGRYTLPGKPPATDPYAIFDRPLSSL
jgi:hypothetical protein